MKIQLKAHRKVITTLKRENRTARKAKMIARRRKTARKIERKRIKKKRRTKETASCLKVQKGQVEWDMG